MSLEELRAAEDTVRLELAEVRARLGTAIAALRAGDAAAEELAGITERGKREGAYRDVAEERARELATQVEAAKAAGPQRERLRREEARLYEKLENIRIDIARRGIQRHILPVLDGIPSAMPCAVRWDDMMGDGDARVCAHCKKPVLSLAMLEPAEAERLLASIGSGALHRRADGTVLAGDCPAGASRQRFLTGATGMILGFFVIMAGALFALTHLPQRERSDSHGPMVAPPPLGQQPDMNQFEGYRPTVGPPAHIKLPATSVMRLEVSHSADELAPSDLEATLTRRGDALEVTRICGGLVDPQANADPKLFDDFIAVVEKHRLLATNPASCPKDDVVKMSVTVGRSTLSVANCSRQWLFDGIVIDEAPTEAGASPMRHRDINEAFDALYNAAKLPCPHADPRRPPSPALLRAR